MWTWVIWFEFFLTFFWKRTFMDEWHRFLWAKCPFSVSKHWWKLKALTPARENHLLAPSITVFLTEGSFLPLCCLSDAVLDGVRSPHAKGNFQGKGRVLACPTTLCRELCKNGWTDWDAACVVGLGEPCIRWGFRNPICERATFRGRACLVMPDDTAISYAKMAEAIKMPFGLWTQVGRRKHVLCGGHIGATWRIWVNWPCAAVMRLYVKLLWPRVVCEMDLVY